MSISGEKPAYIRLSLRIGALYLILIKFIFVNKQENTVSGMYQNLLNDVVIDHAFGETARCDGLRQG